MGKKTRTSFEKGHRKVPGSGRVKGVPNKAQRNLRELLDCRLDDERLWERWNKALYSKDEHIMVKALEMALHYRFGKPVQPIVGEELAPPININVSAIPKFRVPAKE